MFQFTGCPSYDYGFIIRWQVFAPAEFPHSDICGSMPACGSPQLFAAYHVLHRQSVPRHPPCALIRLIYVLWSLLLKHLIGFPHCLGACKIFILESYKRNVLIILCAVFKERFSGTTPENGIVSGRVRTSNSVSFCLCHWVSSAIDLGSW